MPGGAGSPSRFSSAGADSPQNGYDCEGGILYFIASRRRVSVPFESRLVERTRGTAPTDAGNGRRRDDPPPLEEGEVPAMFACGDLPTRRDAAVGPTQPVASDSMCARLMPAGMTPCPCTFRNRGPRSARAGSYWSSSGVRTSSARCGESTCRRCVFGNVQITAQALREITAAGRLSATFPTAAGSMPNQWTGPQTIELRIAQFRRPPIHSVR